MMLVLLSLNTFINYSYLISTKKMRQDLENGIPIERGAIIECLQEIGHVVGVSTPTINIMAALLRETEIASLEK